MASVCDRCPRCTGPLHASREADGAVDLVCGTCGNRLVGAVVAPVVFAVALGAESSKRATGPREGLPDRAPGCDRWHPGVPSVWGLHATRGSRVCRTCNEWRHTGRRTQQ